MPSRRAEIFASPRNGHLDAASAGATFIYGADGPVHAVTGGTADGLLYDSRRRCFYGKPLLRVWLHLALFHPSLVTGTLLLIAVHGGLRTAAVAIYVATVSALFGASALYHRGRWTARQACLLQRLDHAMIFLLIAGTATPAFLIDLPGRSGGHRRVRPVGADAGRGDRAPAVDGCAGAAGRWHLRGARLCRRSRASRGVDAQRADRRGADARWWCALPAGRTRLPPALAGSRSLGLRLSRS